jgi:hypothetical protein
MFCVWRSLKLFFFLNLQLYDIPAVHVWGFEDIQFVGWEFIRPFEEKQY